MANDSYNIPFPARENEQLDPQKTGPNLVSVSEAQARLAVDAAQNHPSSPAFIEMISPYNDAATHTKTIIGYRTSILDSQLQLEVPRSRASLFKKALYLLTGDERSDVTFKVRKGRPYKQYSERDLIKLESEIGSTLFGPIPTGHQREFFCLDDKTWIWYEQYIDIDSGKEKDHTVRYEIHENGILKAHDGAQYTFLEGDELQNLTEAISAYRNQVARKVYRLDPKTGQKLAN